MSGISHRTEIDGDGGDRTGLESIKLIMTTDSERLMLIHSDTPVLYSTIFAKAFGTLLRG